MHNLDTCGGAGCARENDVSDARSAQPHMITAEFIASDYIRTWKKTYEYCRKNIWIIEKNMDFRKKHNGHRKKIWISEKNIMVVEKNIWIVERNMDFRKKHKENIRNW